MKVSLNWLKEYINLDGISLNEIVDKLTMAGLEVEEIINQNDIYKDFLVAEVKEVIKHPNAEKLSICKIFDGKNILQVVCGAPNVAVNQKVVFAPIGAIIPNGNYEIKKAKIRGIESFGMICSEDELLLGNDSSGILVLSDDLIVGSKVTESLNLNDVILEISITPNRPDALSHIGVARDLSAIFNRELKIPSISLVEDEKSIFDYASVEVEDINNCPRYSAKVILNVEVKESPSWLQQKLKAVGLRPINNIVDVTNFVLYEIGQPLHAFDLDLLNDKKIVVRIISKNTEFVTLDSKKRELPAGTLMICDSQREVAIAGIMGGENSEINFNTKNILIESAYFNPSKIRRTSKLLQLQTDSSYRFERGTDPNITKFAAERAAQLIAEIAGGKVLKGTIDVYPKKISPKEIILRFSKLNKVLGFEIEKEKVLIILKNLGFDIYEVQPDEVKVSVPTFRPDVEREIDLIEEVARINGYDNIPIVPKISVTLEKKEDHQKFEDKIRDICIGLGFYEMINNPLVSEKEALLTGNPIKIANPISVDMSSLRTSLFAGALNSVKRNLNLGNKDLMLFEIGNVFNSRVQSEINDFNDFQEKQNLIIVLVGKEQNKTWNYSEKSFDFFSLKSYVNAILSKISLEKFTKDSYNSNENEIFIYYFQKTLNDKIIGSGGKVKKQVLELFDISSDVYLFEFDLSEIKKFDIPVVKYIEPLKYPKIIRDFAFIFDKNIFYEEIENFILTQKLKLLKKVELFDVFESDFIGESKRSLAFRLEFYDETRTLTEEEVEVEFNYLIEKITNNFNAKLRSS
ncbi:MAG: phenylalanine--tRNA ligase subunit beta [Ignavibacterium sp.]|nr:phenylalanine--tRNA ligase subunit beta [Ignavibacterium sp.]MDW8376095.1 phenylalanine--tRNA ligase subunit beta [Ignavibacteriales bacterium]